MTRPGPHETGPAPPRFGYGAHPGPKRDLVGYGRRIPRVVWPGEARVAVNLVVGYEEGSEYSHPAGDSHGEAVGEFSAAINPTPRQQRDLCIESIFEYGSRAGVWRLARVFDQFGVKTTFFASAVALELNPEVGAYIREAGHEACAHGWRWEEVWRLSREQERERIAAAIESIATTCGRRPVGWFNRCTPSIHTRELVVEEGGFLYDSNAYNDDLPYFVEVNGNRHLVVPYSFAYNDMRFVFPGYADPSSFFTYCRYGLDQLWDEGATHPKMMSIGLHPKWVGQAGRARALAEFVEYALEKGGVWFARREDIARWWIEHHEEFTPDEQAPALFDTLISALRTTCDAGRTTLRLRSSTEFFPVAAESRATGVKSVSRAGEGALANAPTFRHVADRLELLVQDDCLNSDVHTPPEVIETYGVKAQILAPVVVDGELRGVVSVHETRAPRHWSDAEISAAASAAEQVRRALESTSDSE